MKKLLYALTALLLWNFAMIQTHVAEDQASEIQRDNDRTIVEKIGVLAESMDTYPLLLLEDPVNYWRKHSTHFWDPFGLNKKRFPTYQEFVKLALSADRQDCEKIIDSLDSSSPKVRALLLIVLYFQAERKFLSVIGRYIEDESVAFPAIPDFESDMKLCWEEIQEGESVWFNVQDYWRKRMASANGYYGSELFYGEKKVRDIVIAMLWTWNLNRKLAHEVQQYPKSVWERKTLIDGRKPVITKFSVFLEELAVTPKSYIDYQVRYLLRGFDFEKREYSLDFLNDLKKEIQESDLTPLQKTVMTFAAFYEFDPEHFMGKLNATEKEFLESLNKGMVLELLTRSDLNTVDSVLFTEHPSPFVSFNIPIRDNKELVERIFGLIRHNYSRHFTFEEIQALVPEMTPFPKRLFTNENWIKKNRP